MKLGKELNFSKELKELIDKELEMVKMEQERNGNKTYSQEEMDAMFLEDDYIRKSIQN